MAVVNGYTTVAEIREHFGDTNTALDEQVVERAIEAASRAIDRFCGRKFYLEATTSVRVYKPDDAYKAWVDDIGSTTGLVVKTDTTADGTWATTWDATDYQLEPLNQDVVGAGTMVQPHAWWRIVAIDDKTFPVATYRPTLQVTARFGWSAVPDDVQEAAILKAAGLVERKSSPHGIQGFGEFGGVRIGRFDPDVATLLWPYAKVTVGAV